jgi:hypothetical protein
MPMIYLKRLQSHHGDGPKLEQNAEAVFGGFAIMIKTRLIFEAAKIRPFLFSDRLLFK